MAKIIGVVLLLASSVILVAGLLASTFFGKVVRLDGQNFIAEIPSSVQAYQKGLGGRRALCQSCAMLFRFPQKGQYAFWMKDMQFDLDILWIADGKIVYIKKNFSAASTEIVQPATPADNVLEIRAGSSDKYGFQVGDRVNIY